MNLDTLKQPDSDPQITFVKTDKGYEVKLSDHNHTHTFQWYRTYHTCDTIWTFKGSPYGITSCNGRLKVPIEIIHISHIWEVFKNDKEFDQFYRNQLKSNFKDETITHFTLPGKWKSVLTVIEVSEIVIEYIKKMTGIRHIKEGKDEKGDFVEYSYPTNLWDVTIKRSKYKTLVELLRDFNKGEFVLEKPSKVSNSSL